jgi:hypothetical protein
MHTSILKLAYIHNEILHVLAIYLGIHCVNIPISIYMCAIFGNIIVYISGTLNLGTSKADT